MKLTWLIICYVYSCGIKTFQGAPETLGHKGKPLLSYTRARRARPCALRSFKKLVALQKVIMNFFYQPEIKYILSKFGKNGNQSLNLNFTSLRMRCVTVRDELEVFVVVRRLVVLVGDSRRTDCVNSFRRNERMNVARN